MRRVGQYLTILFLALLASTSAYAADWKWDYEIEGEGTGVQDTYLVKVTVISKKATVDDATLRKCAIHGVLFRGFESKEYRQQQKPMAKDADKDQQYKAYFEDFFNKDLKPFASVVDDSRQLRMKNKKYHVSATIVVNKETLRHRLEDDGIIKRLNDILQ